VSPPTEQLVHDYLGRLSAAARGRLTRADRRALVMRTRYFLQQTAGQAGAFSAIEVARLLSGLGDPASIVAQEQARLAALRGEPVLSPADRAPRSGRLLRRQQGRASWHWPSQPAGHPELANSLMAAADDPADGWPDAAITGSADGDTAVAVTSADLPGRPSWPSVVARTAAAGNGTSPTGTLGNGSSEAGTAGSSGTAGDSGTGCGAGDTVWPNGLAVSSGVDPSGGRAPSMIGPADPARVIMGLSWLRGRLSLLALRLVRQFRNQPVESAATALLGIGGAAYPPVWLLGAAVALTSRYWDYRDKWTGLALPVLVTVAGTVVGVSLTGSNALGHDAHNAWLFADVLSRVAAVTGASYLLWRALRGRRPPAVPPWHKPHKAG
jgi:hypothetical protein